MNKEKMGKYLRKLRKDKGLSLEQLTKEFEKEYLTVSANAISNWENGKTIPDVDNLYFLASFYGISVDDILDGEEYIEYDFEKQYTLHLPYSTQEEIYKDVYNTPAFFEIITDQAIFIRNRFKFLVMEYVNESISRSENKELLFLLNNYFKLNNDCSNRSFLQKAKYLKKDKKKSEEIWWELQKDYDPIGDIKLSFGQIADERYENIFISRLFDNLETWEKDLLLATLQRKDPVYYDPSTVTSKALVNYEKEHNKEFDRERIYKDTIKYLIEHGACINTAYVGYYFSTTSKQRLIDEIEDEYTSYLQPIYVPVFVKGDEVWYKVKNTARNRLFDNYRYSIVKPLNELGYSYDEIYTIVYENLLEIPDEIYLRAAEKKGLDINRDLKLIKADLHFDLSVLEDAWKELFNKWPTDDAIIDTFQKHEQELQKGEKERVLFICDWVGGRDPAEVEKYVLDKNKEMNYQEYLSYRKTKRTEKLLNELDILTIDDIRHYYFVLGGETDD